MIQSVGRQRLMRFVIIVMMCKRYAHIILVNDI